MKVSGRAECFTDGAQLHVLHVLHGQTHGKEKKQMRKLVCAMSVLMAGAVFTDTLHAAIEIRSDYPGGNV